MTKARVEKYNHAGQYIWHYEGVVIERSACHAVIEARMNRDIPTDYVQFRRGDRMIETFYVDRWYNIFEMHDIDDDRLKGWYCNIARPARLVEHDSGLTIQFEDLALDAFIDPVGNLLVLDEDELDALHLSQQVVRQIWSALDALTEHVTLRLVPFNGVMRLTDG